MNDSEAAVPARVHCEGCAWKADPTPVIPFSAEELTSAAGIKAHLEWEQTQRQRAQNEMQRKDSGRPFPYPPLNFAWCRCDEPKDELIADVEAGDEAARNDLSLIHI